MSSAQDFLDRMSYVLSSHDMDLARDTFALPFIAAMPDESLTATTEAELSRLCAAFRDTMLSLQVDNVIRIAKTVSHLSRTLMVCTYESHVMRGTERIVPPYASSASLRREDGHWRAYNVTNGLSFKAWVTTRSSAMQSFVTPLKAMSHG